MELRGTLRVCTCGDKVLWKGEVSCSAVVIEQWHAGKSGVYKILEALCAVVQADIVKAAQLMPWICAPRSSCMHAESAEIPCATSPQMLHAVLQHQLEGRVVHQTPKLLLQASAQLLEQRLA